MATGTTAIRSPTDDIGNHTIVLRQLKEVAEVGQRLRGDPLDSFVKVSELVDAGLARFTNNQIQPAGSTAGSGGTVTTALSVQGTGSASSPIQLVGDSGSPGNNKLYGTNGSGTKGWYAQPSAGSSTLAGLTDVAISSPSNGQVLSYNSSSSKWVNSSSSSGGPWASVLTNSFASSTTGWASNGSGTWAIVGGVLNQSQNNTNGPCFIYQTRIPFAACRVKVDVDLISAGSGSTQVAGICLSTSASPGSTPTGNVVDECLRFVSGSPNYTSDFFGTSPIASFAYNWGARDTYHTLELIVNGLVRQVYIDGVSVGSFVASGSYAQFQFFGLFSYGGPANFKNFSVDVLTP